MHRNNLPGHIHSQETHAKGGRGMGLKLGTSLGCHSVMLGLCPQPKIFHAVLALLAWSDHQRNPGRIFWCQNFLPCHHGGGLAHPPIDLGCYVSQEDACTTSSPLGLIPGPL